MGTYSDVAHFERIPLRIDVYIAEISGRPQPRSEIAGLRWIDRDYARKGIQVGSALSGHIIPELIARDLM
jgi:hypothetical protein